MTGVGWLDEAEQHIEGVTPDLPCAVAVLRAVLALHVLNTDYGRGWCFGCDRPWPCPTVAAIEAAS